MRTRSAIRYSILATVLVLSLSGCEWFRLEPPSYEPDVFFEKVALAPAVSGMPQYPALAWANGEWGVVCTFLSTLSDPQYRICFMRFSGNGTRTQGPVLINPEIKGNSPCLAWTRDQFVSAYVEHEDEEYRVRFLRLDWNGVMRQDAIVVDGFDDFCELAIAVNDADCMIVWTNNRVRAAVFPIPTGTGSTVSVRKTVSVSESSGSSPSIEWNGEEFVLFWKSGDDACECVFIGRDDEIVAAKSKHVSGVRADRCSLEYRDGRGYYLAALDRPSRSLEFLRFAPETASIVPVSSIACRSVPGYFTIGDDGSRFAALWNEDDGSLFLTR